MTHHWLHSAIEHVLDRRSPNGAPGFTLEDLLDEDNFLGEARAQNRRLLDFLVQHEQLGRLVALLTHSPLPSVPASPPAAVLPSLLTDTVTRAYRHAATVADLLSDVPEVRDALLGDSEMAGALFRLLTRPPPLDAQLVTLVCAVLSAWLDHACVATVEVWLGCEPDPKTVVRAWIAHIHHPSVAKLLSKLASLVASVRDGDSFDSDSSDDPEIVVKRPPASLLRRVRKWLRRGLFIPALLEHLSIGNAYGIREGCEQILLDLLSTVRPASLTCDDGDVEEFGLGADLLTEIAASTLMTTVLVDGTGASIVVRVLLLYAPSDDEDDKPVRADFPPFVEAVNATLPSIGTLLVSAAAADRRVGLRTLKLLEIVQAVACIATRTAWRESVVNALLNSAEQADLQAGVLGASCELFFARPWHNVLHAAILDLYAVLVRALKSSPMLLVRIVLRSNIVPRLAKAAETNAQTQQASHGLRQGHMGHIVSLARILRQTAYSIEELAEALAKIPEWPEVEALSSPRPAANNRLPDSTLLTIAHSLPSEPVVLQSLPAGFTFPELPKALHSPPQPPNPPQSDPALRLTAAMTRMQEQIQNLHSTKAKLDTHPSDVLF